MALLLGHACCMQTLKKAQVIALLSLLPLAACSQPASTQGSGPSASASPVASALSAESPSALPTASASPSATAPSSPQASAAVSASAQPSPSETPVKAITMPEENFQGTPAPTLADACTSCQREQGLAVVHPALGLLEVKLARLKQPSLLYLELYQGGRLVGQSELPADSSIGFTALDSQGQNAWSLGTGNYFDHYGHLYLRHSEHGIIVMHPTYTGYDPRGTQPGGADTRYHYHTLEISPEGEPRLVSSRADLPHYIFRGGSFVESPNEAGLPPRSTKLITPHPEPSQSQENR